MGPSVRGEVIDGDAATVLAAASGTADLIVVGSRGGSGFRTMLFGSVTLFLAAHAAMPGGRDPAPRPLARVRRLRRHAQPGPRRRVAGLQTLGTVDDRSDDEGMTAHITVGFNGIATSAEAVMWAASEALARQLPLRVVAGEETPVFVDAMFGGIDRRGVHRRARGIGAGHRRAARDAGGDRSRPERHDRDDGRSRGGRTAAGSGTADDLVVVGASRHDGIAALVAGSTTRRVLHDSPCPVAVIRGAVSRGRPDRVVVGIDGSEAVGPGRQLGRGRSGPSQVELVIVHGWTYPYEPDDHRSAQARQLTEIDAECTLERAVETARARCGIASPDGSWRASPVSALLEHGLGR